MPRRLPSNLHSVQCSQRDTPARLHFANVLQANFFSALKTERDLLAPQKTVDSLMATVPLDFLPARATYCFAFLKYTEPVGKRHDVAHKPLCMNDDMPMHPMPGYRSSKSMLPALWPCGAEEVLVLAAPPAPQAMAPMRRCADAPMHEDRAAGVGALRVTGLSGMRRPSLHPRHPGVNKLARARASQRLSTFREPSANTLTS